MTITAGQVAALQAIVDTDGTAKGAARHLGVTPKTVANQLLKARRHLNATTTVVAVAIALRDGLITPPARETT